MHFKSVDTDHFDFGESNDKTHKLEEMCLDLGFADVDIRLIDGDYFMVSMEGWTPYMRLGSTIKKAMQALTSMGPSHILDHVDELSIDRDPDDLDDYENECEELFDQTQEQRDKFEGTPEQEAQIDSDLHSYLLFTRMDSETIPWVDRVH